MLTQDQVDKIRKRFDEAVAKYRPTYVHHVVNGNRVTLCASGLITPRATLDFYTKEYHLSRMITGGDIADEVRMGGSLDTLLTRRLNAMTEIVDEEMAKLGVDGFDPPQKTPQTVGED
jgi:hypothetical protein